MMSKVGKRWGLHDPELLHEDSDDVLLKAIGGDLTTTLIACKILNCLTKILVRYSQKESIKISQPL